MGNYEQGSGFNLDKTLLFSNQSGTIDVNNPILDTVTNLQKLWFLLFSSLTFGISATLLKNPKTLSPNIFLTPSTQYTTLCFERNDGEVDWMR